LRLLCSTFALLLAVVADIAAAADIAVAVEIVAVAVAVAAVAEDFSPCSREHRPLDLYLHFPSRYWPFLAVAEIAVAVVVVADQTGCQTWIGDERRALVLA